jgi:hypothetical protein
MRPTRTIEPTAITTLEDWSKAYLKVANVGFDNGTPAVFSRTDDSVVKRLPVEKGVDLYVALNGETRRDDALEMLEERTEALNTKTTELLPGFLDAERQFLEATDAWRVATTPVARRAAALHVGRLSHTLQTAQRSLRDAQRPARFMTIVEDVTHKEMNYTTGDDRVAGSLYSLKSFRIPPQTRVLTEGDTA